MVSADRSAEQRE